MAKWTGITLRNSLGEAGEVPRPKSWYSPDIIVNGTEPLPRPGILTEQAYYDALQSKPMVAEQPNYIYVRGKNFTDSDQAGQWKLFWAPVNILLYPSKWMGNQLRDSTSNLTPALDIRAGEIGATLDAFVWVPPAQDPHCCLVAMALTPGHDDAVMENEGIVDLCEYNINNAHFAQRNVNLVDGDRPSVVDKAGYDHGIEASTVDLMMLFSNLPKGSRFTIASGTPLNGQTLTDSFENSTDNNHKRGWPGLEIPANWTTLFSYTLTLGNDWTGIPEGAIPELTLRAELVMEEGHRLYKYGEPALDLAGNPRLDARMAPVRVLVAGNVVTRYLNARRKPSGWSLASMRAGLQASWQQRGARLFGRVESATQWNGITIRNHLNEKGEVPRTQAYHSPDIVVSPLVPLERPAELANEVNYARQNTRPVRVGQHNFLYVRGKNHTDQDLSGHWNLYWSEPNILLYPKLWAHNKLANGAGNSAPPFAIKAGEIGVSEDAFVWVPPPAKDHYCLIALAVTDDHGDELTRISQIKDLVAYIAQHPHIGQNNLYVVEGNQPSVAGKAYYDQGDEAARIDLAVLFENLPKGSSYTVSVGTPVNGQTLIHRESTTSSANFKYAWVDLDMPAGWEGYLNFELTFGSDWSGIPSGAQPKVTLRGELIQDSKDSLYHLGRVADPGIDGVPRLDRHRAPVKAIIAGSVTTLFTRTAP
ncbi:hypothetical protein [Pseudomonas aegrilactucae]|uniref:Uncharacterized protein n=1 Tax=Pseudomonas aegrilactucae TaxID=2854028 RepID=A0A9Q2XH88_9PSED|nr:hypothetical protein [Pseudomonas aegrilactucae]MBV6286996.1 hypothetical protein [Pseudomonas aegrilactucae]